ncbi:MAG TPA: GAF domain-containing protein [Candidatus Baltobacteraceae bacterium]|nr:GAF domain-containing protein [Candidatus Baltobacteraceae bacterium]
MRRTVVRTVCIVTLTAVAFVIIGSDLALPWHPYGWFGFLVTDGNIVTMATPVAGNAVRDGDRIDLHRLSPEDRLRLTRSDPTGYVLKLPLISKREVTIVAQPLVRSLADNVTDVIEVLATLAYIVIAALLVLLRPAPSTWAFFGFSYGFCIFAATPSTWPFPFAIAFLTLWLISSGISGAAFVSFALRFPDSEPSRVGRVVERALLLGLSPVLVAVSLYGFLAYVFAGNYVSAVRPAVVVTAEVVFAFGIVVLMSRYFLAKVAERNRLRWVVFAFAVAYLPDLNLEALFGAGVVLIPVPSPELINICQAWQVLAPIALAYTVLRHRLFDVRFVVSRALVYVFMTSLVVGAIALVDWAFSRWLAESRFALLAELALALLFGVMLTLLHRRIEHFLNGVVFRTQLLALQALRRFAQEVDLISDPHRLLSQTYEALRVRIECDYAAIYTADGASFVLATPPEPHTPMVMAGDDFAVLRLRRWSEPFECEDPEHPLRAALFVPMVARMQLVGFIVCGPKRDRTHYLPDEIDTLTTLAHRAGSAYLWLTLRPDETGRALPTLHPEGG